MRPVFIRASDRYKLQEEFDKGKIEGELEGKLAVARKMKQKGMSIDEVLEITGLSREDVEVLPL